MGAARLAPMSLLERKGERTLPCARPGALPAMRWRSAIRSARRFSPSTSSNPRCSTSGVIEVDERVRADGTLERDDRSLREGARAL